MRRPLPRYRKDLRLTVGHSNFGCIWRPRDREVQRVRHEPAGINAEIQPEIEICRTPLRGVRVSTSLKSCSARAGRQFSLCSNRQA
jgi:hypothetical protein